MNEKMRTKEEIELKLKYLCGFRDACLECNVQGSAETAQMKIDLIEWVLGNE